MAHEILQRRATFYLYLIKAFDPKQRSIAGRMCWTKNEAVLLYICIFEYVVLCIESGKTQGKIS